jgi:hypothetical protein
MTIYEASKVVMILKVRSPKGRQSQEEQRRS